MCQIFQKAPLSTFFYILVLFSPKHALLEAFLLIKTPKTCFKKKQFWLKKMENWVQNTLVIWVWKRLYDWAAQNIYLKKHCIQILYIAVKHLYTCFLTTFVLRGTFGEIWRTQIQIYPTTYVDLKYGACYLKNKVSAHRLGLVVQLSWVAPP